jgi:hypothetical protein
MWIAIWIYIPWPTMVTISLNFECGLFEGHTSIIIVSPLHHSFGQLVGFMMILWNSIMIYQCLLSQPHFEGVWGWPSHSRNGDLGVLPRLPKTQSLIAGVKTPRLKMFFIPLERSWSSDVKKWPHMSHSDICNTCYGLKSQKSTRPRCVQVECDTPLESY